MNNSPSGNVLSTILRHDRKTTTYKIALLRAINDVALAYPNLEADGSEIAVPLKALADFWIAYYWPFANVECPILQGRRRSRQRGDGYTQDIAFRAELESLRQEWSKCFGGSTPLPSDGYVLVQEMRISRRREQYASSLYKVYQKAVDSVIRRIRYPIRYAGKGQWTVFPAAIRYKPEVGDMKALPGTRPGDICVLIETELWQMFRDLSLWIEALCIHQWALTTPDFNTDAENHVTRGQTYQLLTDRPDNRRPMTWERNRIDILIMEGEVFRCPWTQKRIREGVSYDVDHLFPFSVYPMNELWNLVPTDRYYNQHTKRDRVPKVERLCSAEPILTDTYRAYGRQEELAVALREDVQLRFASVCPDRPTFEEAVAHAAIHFLDEIATYRNLQRY